MKRTWSSVVYNGLKPEKMMTKETKIALGSEQCFSVGLKVIVHLYRNLVVKLFPARKQPAAEVAV